jgi:cytochrome c oxidase assembly factor CtaG
MRHVLTPWSLTSIAIALYVVVGCLHVNEVRTELRREGHSGPADRTGRCEQTGRPREQLVRAALFQAGLLAALIALISPVGYWSSQYIWVRAIQDLLLCFAAPMLIAAGIPRHAVSRPDTKAFRRVEGAAPDRAWSRTSPAIAAVTFNLSCLVWHVPTLFDAVPANGAAQLAEYAVYLGTGCWFWLQIFRPHPGPWHSPLRRLALLTATLAAWTVLGMVLVFGSNVVYPAYANSLHHAMTVLDDQQVSGGVLWMGMMPFLVTAGVILLSAWLDEEDSGRPADAEALIRRRARGWTARSGLR